MELYARYAAIKAKMKELEAEEAEIKPMIIAEFQAKGIDKLDIGAGKLSVTMMKKWTYPEDVVELGEDFKAAKAKAESTGDATCVETPSLRYVEAKL